MKEYQIKKEDTKKYLDILNTIDLFSSHPPKIIKKLLEKMVEVNLPGGEVLINEGDDDCSAYILIYGRLRVKKSAKNSENEHYIADISPGEIVGEICLLTGQGRTATVFAIRDSVLLKLSKKDFDDFSKSNFDVAFEIAKTSVKRLNQQMKATLPGENISTITIAPAGDSNHLIFAKKLYEVLSNKYRCIVIDADVCNNLFGDNIAYASVKGESNQKLVGWLQSLEDDHDFVIYVTDRQMTPWSKRCLRESDHVIFAADTQIHPALNSIEIEYFSSITHEFQTSDLILLHPNNKKEISGTRYWLKGRKVSEFHHIHLNSPKHMQKVVRIITGNAIGVVLNGGGARGFTHIGVLRALEERQIPIDFIGGTSMGAIVSSGLALVEHSEMREYAAEFGRKYRGDYTFPYISLYKGSRLIEFFKKWYKDVCIEDLWTNYFCVSCNLSKGEVNVHSNGLLWKAIRMSTSIPAVFPPVYEGADMIVDGGIVDNLPVNIMRTKMKGGKIIAVNCCCNNQAQASKVYDSEAVSGWRLLLDSLFFKKKGEVGYDNIVNVILSSINLASIAHQEVMAKEADFLIEVDTNEFGLLDFYRFEEIERKGYETAYKIISEMDILD